MNLNGSEVGSLLCQGERFALPLLVKEAKGSNRAQGVINQTGAETDLDAIERWISFRGANPNTARSYRTHAYRLLIWAVAFRNKTISDLNIDDFGQFWEWLASPEPHPSWGEKRLTRGPLSFKSRIQSLSVIQAMLTWLVDGGYLAGNPLRLARFSAAKSSLQPKHADPVDEETSLDRYLPVEIFDWVRDYAAICSADASEKHGEKSEAARLAIRNRFALEWTYWCGARRSEIPRAAMSSIRQIDGVWVWRILGKGGKVVNFPLEDSALEALVDYRISRGLPPYPTVLERDIPILGRLRKSQGQEGEEFISDHQLYLVLKRFFRKAAAATNNPLWAETISKATTHWLRHSYLSHLAIDGADLEFIARRGRHGSVQTTRKHYIHRSLAEEAESLKKLRQR